MKTVTILGSCVSRDLFTEKALKDFYTVEKYFFQIATYDIFSKPLNRPAELINTLPVQNFLRRSCDYDINKTILPILENNKTDYIVIDLYTLGNSALKITDTESNQSVWLSGHFAKSVQPAIEKWPNTKCKYVPFKNIDDSLVKNGLKKLALWLKKNYEEKQIIINYPVYAEFWKDDKGNINKYDDDFLKVIRLRREMVYKFTDYFASLLPQARIFKPNDSPTIAAIFVLSDAQNVKIPSPVHSQKSVILKRANSLFDLMNDDFLPKHEYTAQIEFNYDALYSEYVQKNRIIDKFNNGVYTNLNFYIKNILNLNKHIVLIASKNQASEKLHKFFNKSILQLEMPIKRCQSYIACIDTENAINFENSSDIATEFYYNINEHQIKIMSDYANNLSSIMIDDVEYSPNRRGLNFVILDNRSGCVLDVFYCDTYQDENLIISPKLLIED